MPRLLTTLPTTFRHGMSIHKAPFPISRSAPAGTTLCLQLAVQQVTLVRMLSRPAVEAEALLPACWAEALLLSLFAPA